MVDLSTLNENQRRAVQWGSTPLLVLAGPGSGKTRVLTYRIASIIDQSPDSHFRILGLTFTNKAAKEMRERLEQLVPNAGDRALLTTFHSFSTNLLRQHGSHIGLKPDFEILAQEADRLSMLDEAIASAKIAPTGLTGERLLPLITSLTEGDVAPADSCAVLEGAHFTNPGDIAKVYSQYRSLMIDRNSLDFAGLIAETLGLLRYHAGIRKQVQRVYSHICVDEFQDTNLSQYKILRQLVDPAKQSLFVVADDDQIIYQWNGASPERIRQIRKDFDMDLIQLPENFRCPPAVVKLANELIERNPNRISDKKPLAAYGGSKNASAINLKHFADFSDEAAWVADDIAQHPIKERASCVVLARTKKLLDAVLKALESRGMKGYLAAKKTEFESVPLQWLHSILRLANSSNSRSHLRRVCKAFFTLEGINLNEEDIVSYACAEDKDYLQGWIHSVLSNGGLSTESRSFVTDSLIPALVDRRLDFSAFQEKAFEWLDALPNTTPDIEGVLDDYEAEKSTWRGLVNEIVSENGRTLTLSSLLQGLDLRSKAPEPEKGAVPCFTIHASKGMEFDHVYLVGMVEDQLPSWAAIKKGDDSREMQEERRNCFVAITRAKETLTMTYSTRIDGWPKKPSRFLSEMNVL